MRLCKSSTGLGVPPGHDWLDSHIAGNCLHVDDSSGAEGGRQVPREAGKARDGESYSTRLGTASIRRNGKQDGSGSGILTAGVRITVVVLLREPSKL